jgi:hypothetical protein
MLHAGANVAFDLLQTLRDIVIDSGGSVTGSAAAAHNIAVEAGHDVSVQSVDASDLAVDAGGAIAGGTLHADGMAALTSGSAMSIIHLIADRLGLTSAADLILGDVQAGSSLVVHAPNIALDVTHIGVADPLHIDIAGFLPGTSADSAALNIDAPAGIGFGLYSANRGTIVTTAHVVDMPRGHVAREMRLITPDIHLYLNDVSPTPVRNVGVQLFAPGLDFLLNQDHRRTTTDAFIINYGVSYSVSFLNADGTVVTGFSLSREPVLALNADTWQHLIAANGFGDAERLFLLNLFPGGASNLDVYDDWVQSSTEDGAVNIGDP